MRLWPEYGSITQGHVGGIPAHGHILFVRWLVPYSLFGIRGDMGQHGDAILCGPIFPGFDFSRSELVGFVPIWTAYDLGASPRWDSKVIGGVDPTLRRVCISPAGYQGVLV